MKSFLLLGLFFAGVAALAQDYTGTTVPKNNDSERDSLKKANKILNDSLSGSTPIHVTTSPVSATTPTTNGQGVKAVTTAGVPVRLVAISTLVDSVEIHARKNLTTENTGNVYIGFSATAGQNYRVLTPGSSWYLTAPAGKKIDLNTIFVDSVTNADAVTYSFLN